MSRPELVPDPAPDGLSMPAPDDSPESISSESNPAPDAPLRARMPQAVLVAALVIALLGTGLALINQSREAARLAGEVAVLEAEVSTTASALEAYQIRLEQVRGEVGDLLSRMGALSGLVGREVVPAGLSDAKSDTAPATDAD